MFFLTENDSNSTNGTSNNYFCYEGLNYCVESTIYRKVVGTIIFLVVWPFIVIDLKFFPLGRPAASLLGATLMVLFAVVPQKQVYVILGEQGNLQTLFLLVGMMLLSYYYDREGMLRYVSLYIFGKNKPFKHVLWKVCVLSAVLSAIITNDATCVVLTPLLLAEHMKQDRSKKEYGPLLLGIATSANIGSASTFFGNPQNAFIAANSNGQVSLLVFFITTLPAAVIGIIFSILILYLCYFRTVWPKREPVRGQIQIENGVTPNYDSTLSNIVHQRPTNISGRDEEADVIQPIADEDDLRSKLKKGVFVIWILVVTGVVIILLAIPPPPLVNVEFNLGLVPVGAAVMTMLVDTLLNKKYAVKAMVTVDWTMILMFMGLFVWLAGFQNTLFPLNFVRQHMNLNTVQGVLLFASFVGVGSNVVSNVPLVILIVNQLFIFQCGDSKCTGQLTGVLLAWVSTIAGNFTLIGSVANLIVAEKARNEVDYRLGFF